MNKNLIITVLLILTTFSISVFAFDCQKCKKRAVNCYDIQVKTPSPKTSQDSIPWKNLHGLTQTYPLGFMAGNKECIDFLLSIRFEKNVWETPDIYNGQELNRANFDYILYGEVNGTEGNYNGIITLKNVANEIIKTGKFSFNKAEQSEQEGRNLAVIFGGDEIGGSSDALTKIIKEYEIKKRDKDNGQKNGEIALNPTLEFLNYSYKIEKGKEIEIEIKLTDCDDVPLKNKKIRFDYFKGKIDGNPDNTEALTNSNGVCKVTFTAPDEKTEVKIKGDFHFLYPSGKYGAVYDFTTINVGSSTEFPEKFTMVYDEKINMTDKSGQNESKITVLYKKSKQSYNTYTNAPNGEGGIYYYDVVSVSGNGKAWNWDKNEWVILDVNQSRDDMTGKAWFKFENNLLTLNYYFFQPEEKSPEFWGICDFDWTIINNLTFSMEESQKLDNIEKEKVVSVPKDLKANNVDCEGEFKIIYKGIK